MEPPEAAPNAPGHVVSLFYCTALYYTAPYCTALYCTALYCTALYCPPLSCRVVLDEAQSIKNPRTLSAHAACRLPAVHRWCLSGTPIQNTVDDLQSYFKCVRCMRVGCGALVLLMQIK